MNLQGSRCEFR